MTNIINVLPDSVANQIAAGEVVQRPASAVKELLENSIDAGAGEISLYVNDAGKSLIRVVDNGRGMSDIDARLCIERHATSKISEIADIFRIRTMGFRGEALASIAAVSQLEIKTRTKDEEIATAIEMKGSEVIGQDAASGPPGTSISVKNLFYNVPARRNFLKSNSIENRHILEAFQQIALSHPEVSFRYSNNESEIYRLEKSNFKKRIVELFGKRFDERLIPIEESTEIASIQGFVTKPEFATMKKSEQFFFVNNRYIRSPYFHHAVMLAYEDLLSKDMYPQYFIKIEIDPSQIDVNIHPTKTEIKFIEERSIYAILRTVIRQSLGKYNIAPSLDFNRETAFDIPKFKGDRPVHIPEIKLDPTFNPFDRTNKEIRPSRMNPSGDSAGSMELYDLNNQGRPGAEIKPSKLNSETELTGQQHSKIIQLHNKFILTHIRSGFMVIDQHRAHKRILFEEFANLKSRSYPSQQLLFPVLLEVDPDEVSLINRSKEPFEKAGFSISPMGKDSVSINGVPSGFNERILKEEFHSILESVKTEKSSDEAVFRKITSEIAERMAIPAGQKLSEEEMQNLVDGLFGCDMPYALPNGKPIIITIPLEELNKRFQY